MTKFYLLLLLLTPFLSWSQNLVPNPSFENTGTVPCSWITTQGGFVSGMNNWTLPTNGTSDIFSMNVATTCYSHCFSTNGSAIGGQLPRTGNIMSSILTYGAGCGWQPDYREYLQVQLTSPLIVGQTYYAEMYVSACDYSQDRSNNLGFYFSDVPINVGVCTELNFVPQVNETTVITDSVNWVPISGTFVATSPAQYLIIGNFYDNANTTFVQDASLPSINARYFVDDVYVEEVNLVTEPCLTVSNDTTVCPGTPLTLLADSDSLIGWATTNAPGTLISVDSTLSIIADSNVSYFVYATCDTLTVTVTVPPIPQVDLGNDTTLCSGGNVLLDATFPGASYLWQDNSSNATLNVTQSGTYWVQLSDTCGNIVSDSINIVFDTLPNILPINDTSICSSSLPLNITATATNYDTIFWSNGVGGVNTTSITGFGNYSVQAQNVCGNAIQSFSIDSLPPVSIQSIQDIDTCLLNGQTVTIPLTISNATSITVNGQNYSQSSLTTGQDTSYTIIASNDCSQDTIQFNIQINDWYSFTATQDIDTCLADGTPVNLEVNVTNGTVEWWDGSTNSIQVITTSGNYSYTVSNSCGSETHAISVDYSQFTPLNDIDTCIAYGTGIVLESQHAGQSVLWQANGQDTLFVDQSGTYYAESITDCGSGWDSVVVVLHEEPFLSVSDSLKFCNLPVEIHNLGVVSNESYVVTNENGGMVTQIGTSGVYLITASNQCGTASASVVVSGEGLLFYAPNSFTPDNDIHNDVYSFTGENYTILDVTIFNRWGEEIFQQSNGFDGWDGTSKGIECPTGTYSVRIHYLDCDHIPAETVLHVNLLR